MVWLAVTIWVSFLVWLAQIVWVSVLGWLASFAWVSWLKWLAIPLWASYDCWLARENWASHAAWLRNSFMGFTKLMARIIGSPRQLEDELPPRLLAFDFLQPLELLVLEGHVD